MTKHQHEWVTQAWNKGVSYMFCLSCDACIKSVYKGMTYVPDENLER